MRLVLLRHGRTHANERRLYCGSSDVPLSDGGRRELLHLKEALEYPSLQGMKMITSGMRRTDETLELLFGCAPDVRMPQFREMDFGRFEMHSYDELKDDASYREWIGDQAGEISAPGGESAQEFRTRVFAAADEMQEDALILCHGGVIAALMARWFPEAGKNMYQWQPGFGQGYEVRWETDLPNYRILAAESMD